MLKYACLPRRIWELAANSGWPDSALRDHPDVVWTRLDPAYASLASHEPELSPESGPVIEEHDEAAPMPPSWWMYRSRSSRPRTAVALPGLSLQGDDASELCRLLNDSSNYSWPAIRELCIGWLARSGASPQPFYPRPARRVLNHLLDFISAVFAAKWIAEAGERRLYPTAAEFSFPSDDFILQSFVLGFAPQILDATFGAKAPSLLRLLEGDLPYPTGYPGDPAARHVRLFEDLPLWLGPEAGLWVGNAMPALLSSSIQSKQELVDVLFRENGGYPLPRSMTNLEQLMHCTLLTKEAALGWVWADRWSSWRLLTDLDAAFARAANRGEGVLSEFVPVRMSDDHGLPLRLMADFVPQFRSFVRRILEHAHGERWRNKALDPNERRYLSGMVGFDGYRARDDFMSYAEPPLLVDLVERQWGKAFGGFFERFLPSVGLPKSTKKEVRSLLDRSIELRNALMHSKWALTDEEKREVRRLYDQMDNWLLLVDRYVVDSPRRDAG